MIRMNTYSIYRIHRVQCSDHDDKERRHCSHSKIASANKCKLKY